MKFVPIGDILKVHYGKSLKQDERDPSGNFPVFGSSGYVGNHTATLVDFPTLIIGRKGSVGAVTYAPQGGWPIDTTFYIEPKEEGTTYLRYLYYALVNAKLDRHTITTSIPGLNRNDIYRTEIPLPPLEEQRRIAAILDKADALRAKRRTAVARLDALLQSTFLHLFGDPVTNPKQIPTVSLVDVCTRITDGTHLPPKWANDGVPFLFVSNVVDGKLTFETKKHISMETFTELNARCPIEIGDILYTIVGSYGNAAMVTTNRPFSFQRHIAHIKPDSARIDPYFLLGMLQSPGVKRQADIEARGVAQKTLNLRELKRIQVFLPSEEQQKAYSKIRAKLIRQKDIYKKEEAQLDNLFHALQQRAFNGEL